MRVGGTLLSFLLLILTYGFGLGISLFLPEGASVGLRLGALALGLLLSGFLYYRQFYLPLIHLRTQNHEVHIGALLEALRKRYLQQVGANVDLRLNVMGTRKRFRLRRGPRKSLKIDFHEGVFTPAELELEWDEAEGCCGDALVNNVPSHYDSMTATAVATGLPALKTLATQHVNSILSIPIYSPADTAKNDPLGVLNLDSTDNIGTTQFNQTARQYVAITYAGVVGDVLK